MKPLLQFIILFFCVAALAEENSIIASVNGEPITVFDIVLETRKHESVIAQRYRGDVLESRVRKLRKDTLKSMIERKLIFADYKKQPFQIPPQYIEDALDELANHFGGGSREKLKEAAEQYGTTIDELREKAKEKVAVEILVNEYCRRPASATPKQVYEYYQKHTDMFRRVEELNLNLILIRNDGRFKDRFDAVIRECSEKLKAHDLDLFKAVAMVYSEGSDAALGGELGWVDLPGMRPEFARALKSKHVGSLTKVTLSEHGVCFLYLADRRGGELRAFKEVQQNVRQQIEHEARIKKYNEYVSRLKKDAIIRQF